MTWRAARALASLLVAATVGVAGGEALEWKQLPDLPDTIGLGGPFAGTHNGVLIVAGGANFLNAPPWEDGKKVWHDTVYVLEKGATKWRAEWKLPAPRAYGAPVSTDVGLVLIGGSDAEQVYADVWVLRWDSDKKAIERDTLPPLPHPSSHLVGGLLGEAIYVAAGKRTKDDWSDTKAFWKLDLSRPAAERAWETLEPWPGPPRKKALAAVQSGGGDPRFFYLFSGEHSTKDGDAVTRNYLSDAYRYDPREKAWTRLADLPRPLAAGCAIDIGQSHVLAFSGSAGKHIHKPVGERPEFPADVFTYHTITNTWARAGTMPRSVVTTQAVAWDDRIVIPSGEARPGVRTPQVWAAKPAKAGHFGWVNTAVVVIYLGALVAIGAYFSRREKGTSDFFLAGRRIPWWAAGLSIYATQLSAITFISSPAFSYAKDWIVYPAKITLFLAMPLVIFFYLPFFRRLNITTAYEYLERRYHVAVRLYGSVSFIAFQLVRMAIVLFLPALALSAIAGINIYVCIVLMGVLSTVYTVLGGMEAVIWTDVVQAVVLLGGVLIALIIVLALEGGPGPVYRTALADAKLTMWNWDWSFTSLVTWSCFIGSFALQLGPYTTDQAVIQRYLTTKDEKAAARGLWLNGILSIPFGFLFFALGTCLYVHFKSHPELLTAGMKNDQVFPLFVVRQLPVGVSGLVIAGAFAASMSTLDSSMHSIATAVTTDFYRRFHPQAADKRCLNLARWIVIVVGISATAVATLLVAPDIKSLWFFFQKALGLISSGLVGAFMLGVFTKRANAGGVLIGAATCLGVLIYVCWFTPIHFYLYAVIGIGTCVIVGYLASLAIPPGVRDLTGLTLYSQPKEEA